MKIKKLFYILLAFASISINIYAQYSEPTLLRIGYHTGNRIAVSFNNDGGLSGWGASYIRGEWPKGSGNFYIGDATPLIGVEFINLQNEKLRSVTISRGPRKDQAAKKHPINNYQWTWNPKPGYLNPNGKSPAMSHIPESWPPEGWADHPDWRDAQGRVQWNGYFGRGITNADQESYYLTDDHWYDKYNGSSEQPLFIPNTNDPNRKGMALEMAVRGFQWSNFLAQDVLFWLYDIKNTGTYTYNRAVFGTVIGGVVGGDGDSGDDLASFDITESITYTWDNDGIGNRGQTVGYCAYAYLESPGNPFDGIDNDGNSVDPNSPRFTGDEFKEIEYKVGDKVVLIDPITYERTIYVIPKLPDTVYSLGVKFVIEAGKKFREGFIKEIDRVTGVAIPDSTAFDGIDNNLNGLIDENEAAHYTFWARKRPDGKGVAYKNYITGSGLNDPRIDERRDNDAGNLITSWQRLPDGTIAQVTHWSGDENANWIADRDDVGSDGLGPEDDDYPGPDPDGTEGNGRPDQGEPNFGKTDPEESDQIGLTSFNFFNISASPSMKDDELLWSRMLPGRFDYIDPRPQDGDFIYSSGYFPLLPNTIERFSWAVLFGDDKNDVIRKKSTVQQIYNAGYRFPQPPRKPKINITQEGGKVIIYWNGEKTENSVDFITKKKDFQGYKIYRATEADFADARTITNAYGVLTFDRPYYQMDLKDSISGMFYPTKSLLNQIGGTTFYLGDNTGITNVFVDSNVIPGITYYYAVCAYDAGDENLGIFPTENTKQIFRTPAGILVTDDNTGYIVPASRPAGYEKAKILEFKKASGFVGTGTGGVVIIDDSQIRDNNLYKIVFTDTAKERYTETWSLLDYTAPDTVYIPSQNKMYYVKPGESINVTPGEKIIVNGKEITVTTNSYIGTPDTLINKHRVFSGETPIVHGLRVQLYNDSKIELKREATGFQGVKFDSLPILLFYVYFRGKNPPVNEDNGVGVPSDYRIEFYPNFEFSSVADTVRRTTPPYPRNVIFPAKTTNFRVKNLTTDQYVDYVYFTSGTVSTTHSIYFKENIDGRYVRTWRVDLQFNTKKDTIATQGTLNIITKKPFRSSDVFEFTTQSARINKNLAKSELDKVKVVPNPYVVTHEAEPKLLSNQTSGRGERSIRFTHVPPGSTIKIYTVKGELIKTLKHDNIYHGDVKWNLRTEENLDVAFGVYVYYLDAPGIGSKTGKFALIK
jgi:hypothetical protein